jgi:glutamine synthetase
VSTDPSAESQGAGLPDDVRHVVVYFVDNAGIARCKSITPARWSSAVAHGLGASPVFGVFQGNDKIAPCEGLDSPVGDLRLHPDRSSLVVSRGVGYAAGDQYDQEGQPWHMCPRQFLRRMVAEAADDGLGLRMAYELEWFAAADESGQRPANRGPAYGLAALATSGGYLREIAEALDGGPIGVEQLHPEYGAGQLEVSISAQEPLIAADHAVVLRHVIRSLDRPDRQASFSPLPVRSASGNGCHLHFSVDRDGANLFGTGAPPLRLAPEAAAFMAGVLRELPALVGLACASPASYLRLGPGRWTGATTCWGVENREAPLRLIPGSHRSRPHSANAELKVIDGSSNPYLMAGAVIAAGLHGVRTRAELPPPVNVNPATLPPHERERRRLDDLPTSLWQGADALEASTVLADALGADLHRAIVAVRRGEAADHRDSTPDTILSDYRWRY